MALTTKSVWRFGVPVVCLLAGLLLAATHDVSGGDEIRRSDAPRLVDLVREAQHSVDRLTLGEAIARRAPGARVLVEVNLGEEPQKGGCRPEALAGLVERLRADGLDVAGLMTVPPHDGDPRRWFAALRDLAAALELAELSMGMTDDFEVAVEEGATVVRVGRALFGPRPDMGIG